MGRYLLCGKEAENPYEAEELDLRIFTVEELGFYIFHYLPLLGDDFIDGRLLRFIRSDLELPDIADKIERFYNSPADQDATLLMLLSEIGYFSDQELQDFQARLISRRRKNTPERDFFRAEGFRKLKRYQSALKNYRKLTGPDRDSRISPKLFCDALEASADCCGHLCRFDEAVGLLTSAYETAREERILKKIYNVCVLSGEELPERYFASVSEDRLRDWQQEYWSLETVKRAALPENSVMQLFLKDPRITEEAMKDYLRERRELVRGMLQ